MAGLYTDKVLRQWDRWKGADPWKHWGLVGACSVLGAYTVFHDMGITDEAMREAWGDELFQKNKAAGSGEKARNAADAIYGN